ncbi:DUF302 domain-containing protein [Nodosilinea sp. LEGE 07298]|uniref:DUF302 domain-containing protein n=1 Tax=Nodosilinea sp. LEGE 07298 TaxID=2777970 RepID=UPI00188183CA|nr:DUF302 domain-containing protein [Nodosilinea sp. LEGE 07298]MBE9112412.1 DUF302 domain-containing protein [Nodosilinea sp. LEGE 07298]
MRNISLIGLGLAVGLGFSLSQVMPQRSATAQITTPTGLVIKPSPYSVEETENRFIQTLESNGLNVFATVDHAQNAADASLELPPTRVVIFGNPQAGTPLMQCQQSIGIDLPQKLLIFQNQQGVQIAYNDPRYLGGRHRLNGCGAQVIANVAEALNGLTDQAIAP